MGVVSDEEVSNLNSSGNHQGLALSTGGTGEAFVPPTLESSKWWKTEINNVAIII